MLVAASSPLTKIIPGLMIWTVVFFLIVFFVLRKFAFGSIQKLIDERREQIARSIQEADNARDEARKLLEEHRALMQEARGEAEQILAEARKTGDSLEQRMRDETEQERQRRLEETRKEIAAETARALEQIRSEVADLTLEATAIVVGKKLDAERDRELITEAIGSLDFSRLEESA
ncbi:MAG TPA: F0F1 ATP synthase subunit B [Gaiellaceae bacterium]|nr:F0F1 ATP synthase subunit B [Gaiellaceae bacterium]